MVARQGHAPTAMPAPNPERDGFLARLTSEQLREYHRIHPPGGSTPHTGNLFVNNNYNQSVAQHAPTGTSSSTEVSPTFPDLRPALMTSDAVPAQPSWLRAPDSNSRRTRELSFFF